MFLDYIAEIKAFMDWLMFNQTETVSADAQALWHALMYINNKCPIKVGDKWYWRVEFSAANKTLLSILKFSRQQLDRMRNVLIQAGRIEYKKGKGSQSGFYKMIPIEAKYVTQNVTQSDTKTVTQVWTQAGQNCCTLIINNNTYGGGGDNAAASYDDPESSDVPKDNQVISKDLIHKHFRRPALQSEIDYVSSRLSVYPVELVELGIEAACRGGQPNLKYLCGVFRNFNVRGIKTEDDYWDYQYQMDKSNGLI